MRKCNLKFRNQNRDCFFKIINEHKTTSNNGFLKPLIYWLLNLRADSILHKQIKKT